jgi:hypothetical protein
MAWAPTAAITSGRQRAMSASTFGRSRLISQVIPIHLGIVPRSRLMRASHSPGGFRERARQADLSANIVILQEGESLNEGDGRSPDAQLWKHLYRAAVLETNMDLVPRRVLEARKACGGTSNAVDPGGGGRRTRITRLGVCKSGFGRIGKKVSVRLTFKTRAANSRESRD